MGESPFYREPNVAIIERCKSGDRKSFHELYNLYSRSMFNVSLRILNNAQEAEEVLQDSFLKAFGNIRGYDGRFAFGAWFKRIVINGSLDVLKRRRVKFLPLEGSDFAQEEPDREEEPDYDVEAIRRGMSELPDGYRTVLSLFVFEDYSHREIASLLGISEGTSKSQYNRARKKLVGILKQNTITK
jgi:RNA polymerase sigma factor (sigma-70 family)